MDVSQLSFDFATPSVSTEPVLQLGERQIPITYVRRDRARKYLIYVRADGSVRVTIPRRGSRAAAEEFVAGHHAWIRRKLDQIEARIISPQTWSVGTEVMIRGRMVRLSLQSQGGAHAIECDGQLIPVRQPGINFRPLVEGHLFRLAKRELPTRLYELAENHRLQVAKVTVRNQSSRWGSCSGRGAISLNWRLIQVPPEVSDYVMLHELMHLKEMNHSPRFWSLVFSVCPDYRESELWLKRNASRLGM